MYKRQVSAGAPGFLSKSITVRAMQEQTGDIHHIVPKDYLAKHGYPDRGDYNQVANYVLTETPINIAISNRPPHQYMSDVLTQIQTGVLKLGEIADEDELRRNYVQNAIPEELPQVGAADYPTFLDRRRKLMAGYIKKYYQAL